MGGGSYSADLTSARLRSHKISGTSYFTHDTDIRSGKAAAEVHKLLDPKKDNKVGKNIREAFDSDEHPKSRPVAILFDVTGSMNEVPPILVEKLEKLMAALVKKGYIDDPQILFGGIGDATCDTTPLQIGQFESGNEMDEALSKIYLEGGGGGQQTESYELGMYFMARHTDLHSVTKRGQKGYLFIIGDEMPYSRVKASEVKKYIGDTLQADIPLVDETDSSGNTTAGLLPELQAKYDVFWIMPNKTSYYTDNRVINPLKALFGDRFLKLQDPNDIVEFIVSTIGLNEGYDLDDIKRDLKDIGADPDAITRSSSALVAFSRGGVAKKGSVSGALPVSKTKDSVATV